MFKGSKNDLKPKKRAHHLEKRTNVKSHKHTKKKTDRKEEECRSTPSDS